MRRSFLAAAVVLMMLLSSFPVIASEGGDVWDEGEKDEVPLGAVSDGYCTITVRQPAHGHINVESIDAGGTDNGDGTYTLPLNASMRMRYVPDEDGWDLWTWTSNVSLDFKSGQLNDESDTYCVECTATYDKVVEIYEVRAYRDGDMTWFYNLYRDDGGELCASLINARDETEGMTATSLILPGNVITPDGDIYPVKRVESNAFTDWRGAGWQSAYGSQYTMAARMDYGNITYVMIPASVETILDGAFCSMPGLRLTEFGEGSALKAVGSSAFSGNTGKSYSGFVFGGGDPDHIWDSSDDVRGFVERDISVYEGSYSCGIKVPGISWEEIGYSVSAVSGNSPAAGLSGALIYSDGEYTFLKVRVSRTADFSAGDSFDVKMYDIENPDDARIVRLVFTGLVPTADHVWSAADDAAGAYAAKAYVGEVCNMVLRFPSERWSGLQYTVEVNGDCQESRVGLVRAELLGSGDKGTFVKLFIDDTSSFAVTDTVSVTMKGTTDDSEKKIMFSFEVPIEADEIYALKIVPRPDGSSIISNPTLYVGAGTYDHTFKLTGDLAKKAMGMGILYNACLVRGINDDDEANRIMIALLNAGLHSEVIGEYPSGIVVNVHIPDITEIVGQNISRLTISYGGYFDLDKTYQADGIVSPQDLGISLTIIYHGPEAQMTSNITGSAMSMAGLGGEQMPTGRIGLPEYFHVILPESLETVGDGAFKNASRVDIPVGSHLKAIGEGAFASTCFPLYLSEGVETLGPKALGYGTEVTISPENSYMHMDDGSILSADGSELFRYLGDAEDYAIPDGVRRIAAYALYGNTAVRSVTVPASVEECGMWPFYNVPNLESIIISDGMTAIPDYLFGNIGSGVRSVTIPVSVEKIGFKSFFNTSIEDVLFADGTKISEIGPYAFAFSDKLGHVRFGASAEGYGCIIGNASFYYCNSLSFVEVDDGAVITEIGPYAFAKFRSPGLLDVRAPSFGPSEGGILIPRETEYVGKYAFTCLNNASGSVQSSDDVLEYSAYFVLSNYGSYPSRGDNFTISFEDGSAINSIEAAFLKIGGVKEIDLSACANLETLYGSFFGTGDEGGTVLKLPPSLKYVKDFSFSFPSYAADVYEIPASIKEIGREAFVNLAREVSFAGGSELTSLGQNAFCKGGDSMPSVDLSACGKLENADISGISAKMPAGAYGITNVKGTGEIINADAVVMGAADGILTVGEGVETVNTSALRGLVRADCAPGSPFAFAGGCFTYSRDGTVTVLAWAKDTEEAAVTADSSVTHIASGALSGTSVKVLRLEKEVAVGPRIAAGCSPDAVYILCGTGISVDPDAFAGMSSEPAFYVDRRIAGTVPFLETYGEVYLAFGVGTSHVFLPRTADGLPIEWEDLSFAGGVFSAVPSVNGYTPYDLVIEALGKAVPVEDGRISFAVSGDAVVSVSLRDRTSGDLVEVTFDGDGGLCGGEGAVTVKIPRGSVLRASEVPLFAKDLSDLSGWTAGGSPFDLSSPVGEDTILKASWSARDKPVVTVTALSGTVYVSGTPVSSVTVEPGASLTLHFEALPCYEASGWTYTVSGADTASVAGIADLVLRDIRHDIAVDVSARYIQKSAGTPDYTNRGLPTEESSSVVKVAELGDVVDMSGAVWTGTCSVPLIVDGFIYYRSAGHLYKAESDTGYVAKSVESRNNGTYYHYVGYGEGIILDYLTGKAYDLDLNQVYRFTGSPEYSNGYFYSGGYRFVAADEDPSVPDEQKKLEYVGSLSGAFANYGYPQKIYVDDYVFAVYAKGADRGVTCINTVTGEGSVHIFGSLAGMLLDDGWLTYYDGTLFLTAYSDGLFGDSHSINYDRMAWVDVDTSKDAGEVFGAESFCEFDGCRSAASAFLVWNGKGYVNAGGMLHVFSIGDNETQGESSKKLTLLRTAFINFSHGSLTMDVSHCTEEEDHAVYLYSIPYQSSSWKSVAVVKDDDNGSESFCITNGPWQYNSQAMRADIDGRMVWYNDSCHIHIYTVPEKNRFFFFLDNGSAAVWKESCGATPEDALRSLGASSVTLSDGVPVSLLGMAGDWTVYALEGESGKYAWTETAIGDGDCATVHYFVINGGTLPQAGAEYTLYLEDGTEETYVFADNIGDRSVVGTVFGKEGVVRVKDVDISASEMTLPKGAVWRISAEVTPSDATDKTVVWESSDPSVAAVGQDGTVTAVSPGTALVYVTANDGGLRAYCTVTVTSSGSAKLPAYTIQTSEGIAVTEGSVTVSPDGTVVTSAGTVIRDASGSTVSKEDRTTALHADGSAVLELSNAYGSFGLHVPSGATAGLTFSCISVAISVQERTIVGGSADAFLLSASDASGPVSSFASAVTVTLPYALPGGASAGDVAVWYLPGDGSAERIPCDYADGAVSFETDHFSVYAVGIETGSSGTDADDGGYMPLIVTVCVAVVLFLVTVVIPPFVEGRKR